MFQSTSDLNHIRLNVRYVYLHYVNCSEEKVVSWNCPAPLICSKLTTALTYCLLKARWGELLNINED